MNSELKKVICSGIDDNYLWPWMVSIYSAKLHASEDFSVNLGYVDSTLSVESRELVVNFCTKLDIPIRIHQFDFDYEVQVSHIPVQSYIRILWLDILDEPFLWLDADTLLLENWQEVFNNLNNLNADFVICAALDRDIINNRVNHYPNNLAYQRGGEAYFNDGVFLANPKNWKTQLFHLEWPKIAAHHLELGFEHHNQDILNYMTFKSKEVLDPIYNSMVMQGSQIEQRILHFTGQPKPWHFDVISQSYFSSIELLKERNGTGAFGGVNWLFEYQNYWRHERELLKSLSSDSKLKNPSLLLYKSARKQLMARNDILKHKLLLAIGRKWSSK